MAADRTAVDGLTPPSTVVIVGGGFAGLAAARRLAGRDVRIVVVDQHNFHTFQLLLYQIATAGLSPADVGYPVRAVFGRFANVSFRHATLTGIDPGRRMLALSNRATLGYDRLIIACGSRASYHHIAGFSDRSARYAEETLQQRGIQLRLVVPVAEVTDTEVRLAGGQVIPAGVVIWAGGVTVEAALHLADHPDIFVAGDPAAIRHSPSDPQLVPELPQVDIQSGRHATGQAWRSLRGGSRLIVLINWAGHYPPWPSGPRLIMGDTDPAASVPQEGAPQGRDSQR